MRVGCIGDEGRLQEGARFEARHLGAFAPGENACAVLLGDLDVAKHAFDLRVVDLRAHLGRRIHGVAHLHGLEGFGETFENLVVDLAFDEETRARAAHLALVEENPDLDALDRALEIAVGKENVRGLAAEFERGGNETVGRGLRDVDAHFGRAREGELVKARVLEHRVARGAARTRDDVHDPGGNVAGDDFGEMQKGERGGRGWLDHDRVPGGERRSELPRAHEEREVPRNDLTHDADRLVQDETHRVVVDAHGAPFFGAEASREVAEVVDRERHVDERRLADGLAVVHRFDLREEVGLLLEIVGDAQKNGGALGGRSLRPAFKGGAGGLHRAVHVGGRGRGHAGEHFARGGIARF